jgi:hypothetical protein
MTIAALAADRQWQTGTWAEVKVERPRFVIGIQPRPSGPASQAPAPTEVRTYVIVTDDLRIELKEPVPPSSRPLAVMIGDRVTFALEKNNLYVRADGKTEHRLQVTKRQERKREP